MPSDNPQSFHFSEAANLPVLDRGRIKPLDTLARNELMVISSKQQYADKKGRSAAGDRSGAGRDDQNPS